MKNEYVVTRKLYTSWITENRFKGARLFLFILGCIVSAVCLGLGAMMLYAHSYTYGTYFLILALLGIYQTFFSHMLLARKQYKSLVKQYGQENWTRTIVFHDRNFSASEGNVSVTYPYTDIIDISEKDDKIWLALTNKLVIRLYKSTFVDTDWETCKAKIVSRQ